MTSGVIKISQFQRHVKRVKATEAVVVSRESSLEKLDRHIFDTSTRSASQTDRQAQAKQHTKQQQKSEQKTQMAFKVTTTDDGECWSLVAVWCVVCGRCNRKRVTARQKTESGTVYLFDCRQRPPRPPPPPPLLPPAHTIIIISSSSSCSNRSTVTTDFEAAVTKKVPKASHKRRGSGGDRRFRDLRHTNW